MVDDCRIQRRRADDKGKFSSPRLLQSLRLAFVLNYHQEDDFPPSFLLTVLQRPSAILSVLVYNPATTCHNQPMASWYTNIQSFFTRSKQQRLRIGFWDAFGLIPISEPLDHFNTHLYVVGQSGQGKSKFLQHLLAQLTTTTWGCGLFDPHSDLASDLLAQLASHPRPQPWLSQPSNRQRVIYLDPSRTDYLLPCNILRNPASTPYEIAENVIEAFRRVWPDTLSEAPRFAQIMRNGVLVLVECGLSLLELEALLTHKEFRNRMLAKVKDPLVVSFFKNQFDRWQRDQAIFVSPVLNKVSAFLFQPQVRHMLGANENCLDWRAIIDGGKVLILNLGGFRDEETQRLLGSLFLTSLEQAAFSRSTQPAHERRPFFCMIDEFPLFCARDQTSLARILSECRKYRLHLGLAHQTIAQLPGGRIQGALENARLKVIFGTGRQTAETIARELFMPDTRAVKHEVRDDSAKERTHPVFDPLIEQFESFTQTLQRLRPRHAVVKLADRERVHHVRIPSVPPSQVSGDHLERVKRALSAAVGKPYAVLEEEIAQRTKRMGVPFSLAGDRQPLAEDVPDNQDFWQ